MKDRFTIATTELADKNPYICSSCEVAYGHPAVAPVGREASGHEFGTRSAECILNCEPMPFGD